MRHEYICLKCGQEMGFEVMLQNVAGFCPKCGGQVTLIIHTKPGDTKEVTRTEGGKKTKTLKNVLPFMR